jgi:hypothetical protein
MRLPFEGKVKRTPGTNATKSIRLSRMLIISIYYYSSFFCDGHEEHPTFSERTILEETVYA